MRRLPTPLPPTRRYVETIDLGEEKPRQILSGLAQHMPLDKVLVAIQP